MDRARQVLAQEQLLPPGVRRSYRAASRTVAVGPAVRTVAVRHVAKPCPQQLSLRPEQKTQD
jgi:hypothetical protein